MISKPFARAIFLLPWAVCLAGLSWLIVQRFPPSGTVTFDVPFDGTSAWIDPFLPAERVTVPGPQGDEPWSGQRVVQDPVYTSARLPGVYDEVEIQTEFRTIRQPYVEVGLLRDPASLAFDFQPIWFEPLQRPNWRPVTDGQRQGYVKSTAVSSILGSSDYASLATWHASATPLIAADPAAPPKTVRVTLRGGHDFYALPSNGHLLFTFELQDSNRSRGPDTLLFRIYRGDEELRRIAVGIGGSLDKKMGQVISQTIELADATPGVYRIQFVADDDVFIRSVTTPSAHWVVGPRLVFGDDVGYATSTRAGVAWSDSRHLVFQTFHVEGLQKMTYGDQSIKLIRTHEAFRMDRQDGETTPRKLFAPNGDVRVIGDGWFSFSPEAFFDPQPRRIADATDPDAEGVTGVLTPYERPDALADGWYRSHTVFTLDPSQDHLRLALSAPGLLTRAGAVDVRRIRLIYRRPALTWNEWFRVLRLEAINAWRRLR